MSNEHVYGYCPVCGKPGVSRERRPNGDDRCEVGHTYPSRDALAAPVVGSKELHRDIEQDKTTDPIQDGVSHLWSEVQRLEAELKVEQEKIARMAGVIRNAVGRLGGYGRGDYGEQGDFTPAPLDKTIAELNATFRENVAG